MDLFFIPLLPWSLSSKYSAYYIVGTQIFIKEEWVFAYWVILILPAFEDGSTR